MGRTRVEWLLIIVLALMAIGATIMGLRTMEQTNRMEMTIDTLSKYVCDGLDVQKKGLYHTPIDWEKMEFYCVLDTNIVGIVSLLSNPS